MEVNFDKIYGAFGASGIEPFLNTVENQLTYKLVTGVEKVDPFRGSSAGRGYGHDIFHIYTADRRDVCSGEVLGRAPIPPKSLVAEYLVSGVLLDYDRINVPGFQDNWRACSGEQRHDFPQNFTRYLVERRAIGPKIIGSVWNSVSGEVLGISGRCYGLTVTGDPNVIYKGSYKYPDVP